MHRAVSRRIEGRRRHGARPAAAAATARQTTRRARARSRACPMWRRLSGRAPSLASREAARRVRPSPAARPPATDIPLHRTSAGASDQSSMGEQLVVGHEQAANTATGQRPPQLCRNEQCDDPAGAASASDRSMNSAARSTCAAKPTPARDATAPVAPSGTAIRREASAQRGRAHLEEFGALAPTEDCPGPHRTRPRR